MMDITFGLFASAGKSEQEAILLVKSLRRFGGVYSASPVHIYVPGNRVFSETSLNYLSSLNAYTHSLDIPDSILEFPFAPKVLAAGVFEKQEKNNSGVLVWMDHNSLIFNEPKAVLLPAGKILGYRPVDHKLIGSNWNQPPDNFWNTIYSQSGLSNDRLFPVHTTVDNQQIRPYFNAGMLVVRPQAGLLQTWSDEFLNNFQKEALSYFYDIDYLYKIFIHQVILSIVICKKLNTEQLFELPFNVNYPLHMHDKYPPETRVNKLNELVSCRYESYFEQKNWQSNIIVHNPLASWLDQHLQPLHEFLKNK